MEDEVTVIICLPVEGDPSRYLVPGSIQSQCEDCGAKVWVAPSGQDIISSTNATVVCTRCGLTRVKEEPGSLETSEKQIEEIKTWEKTKTNSKGEK